MTPNLWITQIIPDLCSRNVQYDLRDVVHLHQRIMKLFPKELGASARREAAVLFRLEELPTGFIILVQSALEPLLTALPVSYGRTRSKLLTPLLQSLRPGARVHYRITANATRKLGHNTTAGRPKQVLPLYGAAAEEWWRRQAETSGLLLHTLESTRLDKASGKRSDDSRVSHARTRFDGLATVSDPAALTGRIQTGIGRGKAFGCGLLTIAPVS